MTPTRRTTRKPGPKKPIKVDRIESESEEEESSDAGSVTRCICGEAHNLGLMVQCDKCEVWQHCECIGLIQEKLPDHYYCDQCQPENHQLIKTSSGRSKRLYSSTVIDATTIIDETIVQETKKPTKRRKIAPRHNSNSNNSSASRKEPSPVQQETASLISVSPSSSPTLKQEEEEVTKEEGEQDEDVIEERTTRSRRTKIPDEELPKRKASSSHPKPSSSPSTEDSHISLTYWNYTDGKPMRASSPPAKIKYPHAKMSLSDMTKRAQQIMEFISKIEVNKAPREEFAFVRQRSLSCSSTSSLSSASTVPLLDYNTSCSSASSPSTPVPQEESSYEILDRVNRELTKFQRKFGVVYDVDSSAVVDKK